MSAGVPDHFATLGPFQDWFRTGSPILTYHKFGAPPRGARLRGLHVREALFRRQLEELRDAGYGPGAVDLLSGGVPGRTGNPPLALTIDDGFLSVHRVALPLLVEFGFRATLYLVADRLGGVNDWETAQGEVEAPMMSAGEVREWLGAGQKIGAHTLTHPWLTRIPRAAAREEIRASRARLEDLLGVEVTDFCYPYGDWNAEVREEVVAAGFRTAVTTELGLNGPGSDPFALKRITARHASRGWRAIRAWWRRRRGQVGSPGSSPSASQRG